MNYRELFDRYKKGLADEEEKRLVEEEIEKYEALEEYLSEVLDEEFDSIVNTNGFEDQEKETIKLKKSVRTKLRKVVLTSVMIVIAFYIGIFYILSDFVDLLYYDPTAVTQSQRQESRYPDFYYDMQAYISLNMPGYAIDSFTFQESKGFGEYEVSYGLRDLFSNKSQRYFVNILRGKLTYAMGGIFGRENRLYIWEGLEKVHYYHSDDSRENTITARNREIQRKNDVTLRYLNNLNPLSYVSMSIVFEKDLTMEEFYHMIVEHSSLNFKWAGVRTVEPGKQGSEIQSMHLIGFNPNFNDEPSTTHRPDPDKYPLFYLLDMMDDNSISKKGYPNAISEAYEIHFRSRLEYLRNQEDFIRIFDYNHYKIDFYEDAIDYIDKNGVKTYGVLVFATAEELLESINKIPYDTIYINEVLPTKPNIYYD